MKLKNKTKIKDII